MFNSYVAIGDSFTEGVGDPREDGSLRGWADLVAEGLATHARAQGISQSFRYANLAIRGRLLEPMLAEQLPVAIEMKPDLISINGGGNDMLRPGFDVEKGHSLLQDAIGRILDQGITVLLLSGPDPSGHLPMGRVFHRRGKEFTALTAPWVRDLDGVYYCDNFNDPIFHDTTYWSADGLHLCAAGYRRVAANCLNTLGIPVPDLWPDPYSPPADPKRYTSFGYYRSYVFPWIGRRLRGESSGDGRTAKRPELMSVHFPG